VVSAICVGGTFMVVTMATIQEARRISMGNPTKLVAALTAAFGLGQLAGPVVVTRPLAAGSAFTVPSAVAAAVLLCSAFALLLAPDTVVPGTQPLPDERTR
jgi:hypothetical protein